MPEEGECRGLAYDIERRAGELLRAKWQYGGERHEGRGIKKTGSQAATPKLADLGVTKTQSSHWQRLAAMKRTPS